MQQKILHLLHTGRRPGSRLDTKQALAPAHKFQLQEIDVLHNVMSVCLSRQQGE